MSTPQVPTTKGPRRSSRRTKSTNTGFSEGDQPATDSGPSPPDTGYVGATTPGAPVQVNSQRPRKQSQSAKKTQNPQKPDRAFPQDHTSPPPNLPYPSQRQGTPIKQAYAGPTFHSSPAPSALPMPSFYSKSMPSIVPSKTPDIKEESDDPEITESKTEDSTIIQTGVPGKRESTPLDFLFEAARQARDTPRADSPASRSANLSAVEDSPLRRSPAPREGGDTVFPFELDGNGPGRDSIGPAFATPYKERIMALRSPNASPSIPSTTLDEDERKIKTEALKKMLMNSTPNPAQRSASASPYQADQSNPFNARMPDLRSSNPLSHQTRHHSGPSTPVPFSNASEPHQYFSGLPPTAHGPRMNGSPMHRPASSHLRRQYHVQDHEYQVGLASDNNSSVPQISTARDAVTRNQSPYRSSNSNSTALPRAGQHPNHNSSRSAQQLEDDLRRVLKLNLTSTN